MTNASVRDATVTANGAELIYQRLRDRDCPADVISGRQLYRKSSRGSMANMSYREFAPPAELGHIIECYWCLTPVMHGDVAQVARIFPDGSTDIVVSDADVRVQAAASAFVLLPLTKTIWGARFRPAAAKVALGVSPTELESGPVSIKTLWGRDARELDGCYDNQPEMTFELLSRALIGRLAKNVALDEVVQASVTILAQTQACKVEALATELGCSERHLRRRFRDHTGLGVKQFARILRFQRVLDIVRTQKRKGVCIRSSWAVLAIDLGFADQAHLIREVNAFSGLSPAELWWSV